MISLLQAAHIPSKKKKWPKPLFIHDDIVAFDRSRSHCVIKLGNRGVVERHADVDMLEDISKEPPVYEISRDGRSLLIARFDILGQLDVVQVSITAAHYGEVIHRIHIPLELTSYEHLILRDPYVAFTLVASDSNIDHIMIIDWRSETGIVTVLAAAPDLGLDVQFHLDF